MVKRLALLASVLFVGAAEARITFYRNQDVLVDTLKSAKFGQFLENTTLNDGRETISLAGADLVEASLEVLTTSSGANKTYDQRLVFEVRGRTGRTSQCRVPVSRTYEIVKSPQGITFSRLGEPNVGNVRCR